MHFRIWSCIVHYWFPNVRRKQNLFRHKYPSCLYQNMCETQHFNFLSPITQSFSICEIQSYLLCITLKIFYSCKSSAQQETRHNKLQVESYISIFHISKGWSPTNKNMWDSTKIVGHRIFERYFLSAQENVSWIFLVEQVQVVNFPQNSTYF